MSIRISYENILQEVLLENHLLHEAQREEERQPLNEEYMYFRKS